MARLTRDWRALDAEQRLALGAAVGLFFTMLLPWYQQNGVVNAPKGQPHLLSGNLNAFQVFSFVEAAVLVVALAVGYMLYARAEGRRFQVPGSDGAVVFAAGLWAALLLIYRLFDKPGISSHGIAANVGVQWGIFFALAAAGLLAYAGSRMRAAAHHALGGQPAGGAPRHRHRHSGPDPGGAPEPGPDPERDRWREPLDPERRDRERSDPERRDPDRPDRRDPVPARPPDLGDAFTTVQPPRGEGETVAGRTRPRYPPAPAPAPAEQMSFDDTPDEEG